MSTVIKIYFYRFFVWLIAFLQMCIPSLDKKLYSVDPTSGDVNVIAEPGYAARVYPLGDGRLLAGYELDNKIFTVISSDGGKTWENKTLAVEFEGLTCSNISFLRVGDLIYLAYRAIGFREDGSFYGSLRVSVSENDGLDWKYHSLIAENIEADGNFKGVWEPFLIMVNGELTCFYANDSTAVTKYQNIETRTFDGEKWGNTVIVSNGTDHESRDGMPVVCHLSEGGYVLAIESTKYSENYPFIIQILYSQNGVDWSEPKDVYIPKSKGSKAAAPGIAETADGRLIITFQTDEDKDTKGDSVSIAKVITAKTTNLKAISPALFSKPEAIFPEEHNDFSLWGGIYTDGQKAYYAAGTPKGAVMNVFDI